MRYFHRTSVSLADVLDEADRFFGASLAPGNRTNKRRTFSGSVGGVTVSVRADGGHYTLVTVVTDQVGESEVDKLAKRFLTMVHTRADARHAVRGAY